MVYFISISAVFNVKDSLNHFPRSDLSVCEKEFETIWVEIKPNHGKNILCCCSYRHPNTDKEKFIQYLDLVASKVAKEKKLIYLMGNFNFDLLQYEFDLLQYDTDNNSYDFLNSIVENGMLPFIHQPTRIIDSSATLIDNIFSNNIEDESISGNLFIKLSDHLPQFVIINRTEDRHKQANFYKHDYQKFDKESFQDDFSLQNWANLEKADLDASQKFDDFLWRVNSCVNRHAPLKKVVKKKLKLSLKPWITNKIIKMMHHRDRLFSKWNNDRLNGHFQNAYKNLETAPDRKSEKASESITITISRYINQT